MKDNFYQLRNICITGSVWFLVGYFVNVFNSECSDPSRFCWVSFGCILPLICHYVSVAGVFIFNKIRTRKK